MGANASRKPTLPFNPSDYEEIRPKNPTQEPLSYRILRHIRTGIEMQEYRLQFNDERQYQDFYDAYEWRLQQEYVVNTCHLVENHRKEFCSTHYGAFLYTERIPIKLSQIKDIPYPDNLYILYASLEGFHTVYHKTGFFEVQQHMICINKQGKVKVWINDNLSKKYPDPAYTQTDGCEEDMVKRIIQLIDYNTDAASQPTSVLEYIIKHLSRPSFGDAKMLLRQYVKEHGVSIPRSFECILEVLNSDYSPTEMTDSRAEQFRTFNGKGSRQAPSVRSHGRNHLRERSRGDRSVKYSRAGSQSNNSFHELPKQSTRHRGDILNSRINLTRSSQIMNQPHPGHLLQSRLQTVAGLLPMQHSPTMRQANVFKQQPLPVITENRQLIQHVYHPVPGGMHPNFLVQAAPSNMPQGPRPIFYSVNQQPEAIISTAPSREHIHFTTEPPRPSNRDRRLNIYSESDDSQLQIESQSMRDVQQQVPTYTQHIAGPMQIRQMPVMMHHYNIGQPLQGPYIINGNQFVAEQLHHQQSAHKLNIYQQEESVRSNPKPRSLSRSKKYNSDAEGSRSVSRKHHHHKKPRHQESNSDQSLTEEDEYYEDERKKGRKKQQQGHYKKQQHVIDEDEDDDDQQQRIRKSRRRERRYREDQAKLKVYRDRQDQQFQRQKEQEEYRRRRQEDQFRRRREQQEFRRRMELQQQQHRQRKAQEDFQRRTAFEQETRRQRQRQSDYLRQKHREEMEYNNSRSNQQSGLVRMNSDTSSQHDFSRNSQHFQFQQPNEATRSSNHIQMQAGRRPEEQIIYRQRGDAPAFKYYSSDQDHQLDPEIARDLMVMQL